MTEHHKEEKMDIMRRIGNDSVFTFVITVLVERLQSDPKLEKYFARYDPVNLFVHQTQVLKAALLSSKQASSAKAESFILLRHYSLIDKGFNQKDFKLVIKHFQFAMEDAWVDEDVIRDAVAVLVTFTRIFTKKNFKTGIHDEEEKESTVPVNEDSSSSRTSSITQRPREMKIPVDRSFSGDKLLKMMRLKGAKRTKHEVQ